MRVTVTAGADAEAPLSLKERIEFIELRKFRAAVCEAEAACPKHNESDTATALKDLQRILGRLEIGAAPTPVPTPFDTEEGV